MNMLQNQFHVPIVIETTGRTERAYDIYSRLLKDRIVFINGPINDDTAQSVVAQLLFLSNEDSKADISMYINSPGGSVTSGLGIYDTMQYLRCAVATYCIGQTASMGAVLMAAGEHGKRYVLPNSRFLLHQPLLGGVLEGAATDLSIEAKNILQMRKRIYEIFSRHTGQEFQKIEKDCDRNLWLEAQESVDYGLADVILDRMPDSDDGDS
jgi:ATP-dependent Clp protease protease subunit